MSPDCICCDFKMTPGGALLIRASYQLFMATSLVYRGWLFKIPSRVFQYSISLTSIALSHDIGTVFLHAHDWLMLKYICIETCPQKEFSSVSLIKQFNKNQFPCQSEFSRRSKRKILMCENKFAASLFVVCCFFLNVVCYMQVWLEEDVELYDFAKVKPLIKKKQVKVWT